MNEILKMIRTACGISRKELSKKSGMSYSYLTLVERKPGPTNLKIMNAYSAITNVPIYIFYLLEEKLQGDLPYVNKMYIVTDTILHTNLIGDVKK